MNEMQRNNNKFSEHPDAHKPSVIDFTRLHSMLQKRKIVVTMNDLRSALVAYRRKDHLIADLIDACYAPNDQSSFHGSSIDHIQRHLIYRIILFRYFQKNAINNSNFIKIAEMLLRKHYPCVDIAEFRQTTMNSKINGNMFANCTSVKFAKIFKHIKGYKKKHLTNLYVKMNSIWDDTELDMSHDGIE
eukprot:831953_1